MLFSAVTSRLEKTNAQVVTRSRSGSLAPKAAGDTSNAVSGAVATGKLETVSGKATPEEIKEKMEQQLRMQRAAHQQKRALETLKVPGGQVLKVVPSTQQSELNRRKCSIYFDLHILITVRLSYYKKYENKGETHTEK